MEWSLINCPNLGIKTKLEHIILEMVLNLKWHLDQIEVVAKSIKGQKKKKLPHKTCVYLSFPRVRSVGEIIPWGAFN